MKLLGLILFLLALIQVDDTLAQCHHMRKNRKRATETTVEIQPRSFDCSSFPWNKYRTITGECNNLVHPESGVAPSVMKRFLPPIWNDANGALHDDEFVGNGKLPLVRTISTAFSNAIVPPGRRGRRISESFMQWGQFMTHDTVSTAFDFALFGACCPDGLTFNSDDVCDPMDFRGDPYFQSFGQDCTAWTRNNFVDPGNGDLREQENLITSVVDASVVYGSTVEEENALRSFYRGQLVVDDEKEIDSQPDWFFLNTTAPIFAGDVRAAMTGSLLAFQNLFTLAHNDWAQELWAKNWWLWFHPNADEIIFQEIRRIMGGVIQSINFKTYLPIVLGPKKAEVFQDDDGMFPYRNDYNQNVSATLPNIFLHAFRLHSHITDTGNGRNDSAFDIVQGMFNPDFVRDETRYPSFIVSNQPFHEADASDASMVESTRNRLFALPTSNFDFGLDLMSFNLKRSRDFGHRSYNDFREFCGLDRIENFTQLADVVHEGYAEIMEFLYGDVDNIEVYLGGLSERVVSDGVVGPLFACLLRRSFLRLVRGDRFFYTHQDNPYKFSEEQIRSLDATSVAVLLCKYAARLDRVQRNVFLLPDDKCNPVVSCEEILDNSNVAQTIGSKMWRIPQHILQHHFYHSREVIPMLKETMIEN